VRGLVDGFGDAGGFAAHEEDVTRLELEAGVGCAGFSGEQDEAPGLLGLLEGCPRRGAGDVDLVEVIHAGAAEARIIPTESCGLYDGQGQAQTGTKPCDCADIWGNIWLVQGNFDHGGGGVAHLSSCSQDATSYSWTYGARDAKYSPKFGTLGCFPTALPQGLDYGDTRSSKRAA
jgi:hypothetical protein